MLHLQHWFWATSRAPRLGSIAPHKIEIARTSENLAPPLTFTPPPNPALIRNPKLRLRRSLVESRLKDMDRVTHRQFNECVVCLLQASATQFEGHSILLPSISGRNLGFSVISVPTLPTYKNLRFLRHDNPIRIRSLHGSRCLPSRRSRSGLARNDAYASAARGHGRIATVDRRKRATG